MLRDKEIGDILGQIECSYEVSQREAKEDLEEFMGCLERERIILAAG